MPRWFDAMKAAFSSGAHTTNPNYQVSMQMYNPGNPVWTPHNYRNFVENGYKKSSTVFACVNKIANAASGIRWKLYTDIDMRREIKSHALLDLWRRPNPQSGGAAFIRRQFGYWHLSGNAYTWAYRPSPKESPLALWAMNPGSMKIVAGDHGIEKYIFGYGTSGERALSTEDVQHWKFHDYLNEWYGMSPLSVAMYLVDLQVAGQDWNIAMLQNFGKPSAVFMSKSYLTDQQRNQIKEELRRKFSGRRNAGMPLVLEADMQYQPMSLSPAELDWLAGREITTREIAAIYDIAPELVADSAGKTFANVSEARQALYIENILPKLDVIRDDLNAWLVPMYKDLRASGAYFSYDKNDIEALAELYRKAQKEMSETATSLWNTGQCTMNEARERHGLVKVKGGDIYKFGVILVDAKKLPEYVEKMNSPAATLDNDADEHRTTATQKPPAEEESRRVGQEMRSENARAQEKTEEDYETKTTGTLSYASDEDRLSLQLSGVRMGCNESSRIQSEISQRKLDILLAVPEQQTSQRHIDDSLLCNTYVDSSSQNRYSGNDYRAFLERYR